MHVLIIDDNEECCDLLKTFLENEGFSACTALTGVEGLQLVRQLHPALVILDVRMPGMDGREVCRRIRSFSDVPVLMISSVARQVGDIVEGLNLGADDYLAKPLDFDLLRAHVMALLRRSGKVDWCREHPIYVDSYLMVDLRNQRVCVQGKMVSLSPLEYQLLELLVCNVNQVVPMIEIIEYLWPDADCFANTTRNCAYSCIKTLRQVIEPEPQSPSYIVSEHGLGYRFTSET